MTTSSSDFSPASSLLSLQSSAITTPRSSEVKGSKPGRGRPHKEKSGTDYSDFPINGSKEDHERWFRAKVTERWCYAKLSGAEGEEYRESERARNLEYYYNKCGGRSQSQGQSGRFDTGVEGVQYLDEPDDKKSQSQAKSHQR